MLHAVSFENQLAKTYASLSPKLRDAADFVVANPIEVAMRSLRRVSKDARLSPATFSRMSSAVGYDSYEDLREDLRTTIGRRADKFSHKVEALQQRHDDGDRSFAAQHIMDSARNTQDLGDAVDAETLEACVDRLQHARRVLVTGALGSTCVAEYLNYMASFIAENWSMANRMGESMASGLVGLTEQDVFIVVTKPPYVDLSVRAADEARQLGAFVIVITDSLACPALVHASASFIVPTESQHFFSSYASTLVLCEILVGSLAARSGSDARARISKVERQNRRLNEVRRG